MTSIKKKREEYREINLTEIIEPDGRARMSIPEEHIETLANSIQEFGLRQAIEVVKSGDKYEIVYGERRVLAHRRLDRKNIWAKVVNLTREEVIIIRALENVARKELSPIEEAVSFQSLKDEFGLTSEKIAKKVGRTFGNVKRRLDLLRMSPGVQKAVHEGKISIGVAEALWRCRDAAHQEYLLDLAIEHGVTVAVVRTWVEQHEKEQRRGKGDNEGGGGIEETFQSRTTYVTCEVCDGGFDVMKMQNLSVCVDCKKQIKNAIKK